MRGSSNRRTKFLRLIRTDKDAPARLELKRDAPPAAHAVEPGGPVKRRAKARSPPGGYVVNLLMLENVTSFEKNLIYRQSKPNGYTFFSNLYGQRREGVKNDAEEKKKGEKRLVRCVWSDARYSEYTAHQQDEKPAQRWRTLGIAVENSSSICGVTLHKSTPRYVDLALDLSRPFKDLTNHTVRIGPLNLRLKTQEDAVTQGGQGGAADVF